MLDKLNSFLVALSLKKAFFLFAFIAFLADLLNIFYITGSMLNIALSDGLIATALSRQGVDIRYISSAEIKEMKELIANTLQFVLWVFMLIHSFIYLALGFRKPFAIKYVSGYAFIGAVLTVFQIPSMVQLQQWLWIIVMIILAIGYLFIWYGIKKLAVK